MVYYHKRDDLELSIAVCFTSIPHLGFHIIVKLDRFGTQRPQYSYSNISEEGAHLADCSCNTLLVQSSGHRQHRSHKTPFITVRQRCPIAGAMFFSEVYACCFPLVRCLASSAISVSWAPLIEDSILTGAAQWQWLSTLAIWCRSIQWK